MSSCPDVTLLGSLFQRVQIRSTTASFCATAWRMAPEFPAPSPDRFVRHDDATLQRHFLDQPQAQGEPKIQPDRMRDDLMWKAVVLLLIGGGLIPAQLSANR